LLGLEMVFPSSKDNFRIPRYAQIRVLPAYFWRPPPGPEHFSLFQLFFARLIFITFRLGGNQVGGFGPVFGPRLKLLGGLMLACFYLGGIGGMAPSPPGYLFVVPGGGFDPSRGLFKLSGCDPQRVLAASDLPSTNTLGAQTASWPRILSGLVNLRSGFFAIAFWLFFPAPARFSAFPICPRRNVKRNGSGGGNQHPAKWRKPAYFLGERAGNFSKIVAPFLP